MIDSGRRLRLCPDFCWCSASEFALLEPRCDPSGGPSHSVYRSACIHSMVSDRQSVQVNLCERMRQ